MRLRCPKHRDSGDGFVFRWSGPFLRRPQNYRFHIDFNICFRYTFFGFFPFLPERQAIPQSTADESFKNF